MWWFGYSHLHPPLGYKGYIVLLFLGDIYIAITPIYRRIEVDEDNASMVGEDNIKSENWDGRR